MIRALTRSLAQFGDRAFLGPLLKGGLAAVALFAALAVASGWLLAQQAGGTGWLAGLAGAAGGAAALGLAWWLFVPAFLALATLFLDPVAAAVEARYNPALPAAVGAGLLPRLGYNLKVAGLLGLGVLAALPIALLAPPVGAVALWAVNVIALGPLLFESMAQRRFSIEASRLARRARQWRVLVAGGVLAGLALLPVVNLLVPVLGAAVVTHLLHEPA